MTEDVHRYMEETMLQLVATGIAIPQDGSDEEAIGKAMGMLMVSASVVEGKMGMIGKRHGELRDTLIAALKNFMLKEQAELAEKCDGQS